MSGEGGRRPRWRAGLLATTAMVAIGITSPQPALADTTIPPPFTNVPPDIVDPGTLTVRGILLINGRSTVDVGSVLIEQGGSIRSRNGEVIVAGRMDIGGAATQGTVRIESRSSLTAGDIVIEAPGR